MTRGGVFKRKDAPPMMAAPMNVSSNSSAFVLFGRFLAFSEIYRWKPGSERCTDNRNRVSVDIRTPGSEAAGRNGADLMRTGTS
ncbi:flagellar hook-associated protein FlgL [Anopheles sinensis]|uniref:Flagellar hook-associated protein FlgL n=1 Tax=Anopheles sinensis TaxID=74873 RepID=A0A084W8I9_ANOSI|nr:flagellar hook-associated protein FlgL [Anopheles sinensis]